MKTITKVFSGVMNLDDSNEIFPSVHHKEAKNGIFRGNSSMIKFQSIKGGLCKWLGAWGGDFVLASGEGDVATYFRQQGFTTIFKYETLVLV